MVMTVPRGIRVVLVLVVTVNVHAAPKLTVPVAVKSGVVSVKLPLGRRSRSKTVSDRLDDHAGGVGGTLFCARTVPEIL